MEKILRVIVAISFIGTISFASPTLSEEEGHEMNDPITVYKKYLQALGEKKIDNIKEFLSLDKRRELENNIHSDEIITMIESLTPKRVEVKDKIIDKDQARLEVEGKVSIDAHPKAHGNAELRVKKRYGKIILKKENGMWKIEKETWRDSPFLNNGNDI